jgi:hypothetical protein
MSNTRKTQEFLSYIRTPLSQNSLNVLYSANNVKFERCQLFSDFTQSLISKVIDTYMGDTYTTPVQRIEHFKWCWDENIQDFMNENIELKHSMELFHYFQQFMVDSFYASTDKDEMDVVKHKLTKLWKYILGYTTNKTRSDVDTFLEVYKIFEKTLK